MLCVTEKVTEQLGGDIKVDGTVIELPVFSDKLKEASGRVYVIVTGMLSFEDYEAIEELGAIRTTPEELLNIARKEPEDYELDLDGGEEEVVENKPDKTEVELTRKNLLPQAEPRKTEKIATLPTRLINVSSKGFLSSPRRGYIVCCFSSAGGVGKTFLSTNLGCVASINGISTVICDMDLGYGDVDIATGLTRGPDEKRMTVADRKARGPKTNWATVTSWRKHARDLKESILQHHSGLYALPSFPYAGEGISAPETEDLLSALSEIFGLVVVDLGVNAFSPYAKAALSMSEIVFIVAKQDAKSIGKISHFLNQEGGKDNMRFVVNMIDPAAHYSPKEIAVECGFKEFDTIPIDVSGASSATKKNQMVAQMKGSPACEALWKIAAAHLPYNITHTETGTEGKVSGPFSFLKKIFKKGGR